MGIFQIAEDKSLPTERMHQDNARGKSKRRENCEMGRWSEGGREGERDGVTFAVEKEMWKRVN